MQEAKETNSDKINPKGLYKDPLSGNEMGCIDEVQADAAVKAGFVLIKGDIHKTQAEMDADKAPAKKEK